MICCVRRPRWTIPRFSGLVGDAALRAGPYRPALQAGRGRRQAGSRAVARRKTGRAARAAPVCCCRGAPQAWMPGPGRRQHLQRAAKTSAGTCNHHSTCLPPRWLRRPGGSLWWAPMRCLANADRDEREHDRSHVPAGSTGQSAALKAMIASLKNKAAQRAAKQGKRQLGAQGKAGKSGKERSR